MDPYNPYDPPRAFDGAPPASEPVREGSYALGFLVGIAFALLGLLLAYGFGKPETKRGALHGFLVRLGLALVVVIALVLFA